jgi:uncharacterized phage protein (TIGR02216 family)
MSGSFGAAAALLAGHAGRLLGWRAEEFWRATPAELAAILGPPDAAACPFDRATLTQLMERDNDRPR